MCLSAAPTPSSFVQDAPSLSRIKVDQVSILMDLNTSCGKSFGLRSLSRLTFKRFQNSSRTCTYVTAGMYCFCTVFLGEEKTSSCQCPLENRRTPVAYKSIFYMFLEVPNPALSDVANFILTYVFLLYIREATWFLFTGDFQIFIPLGGYLSDVFFHDFGTQNPNDICSRNFWFVQDH